MSSSADTPIHPPTPGAAGTDAPSNSREFLAFKLGSEEYGIDIPRVQEIRSYEPSTRMAQAPAYVKGVLNLHGVMVPIVDLRIKCNLTPVRYDAGTAVIVLNTGSQKVGVVVDRVSGVVALTPEQLRPAPELSSVISREYVMAIGSVGHRMLILLDIEKLMNSDEMRLLREKFQ